MYVDLLFQAISLAYREVSDVKYVKYNNTNLDLDPPWLYNKKARYLNMLIILY